MAKTGAHIDRADKLRRLRGQIPVAVFAKELGINLTTYYRYERGDTMVSDGYLKLAEIVSAKYQLDKNEVHNAKLEYDLHGGWRPRSIEQMAGVPEGLGMGRAVEMLARIYQSKNAAVITAICANLRVFCERIAQEDEIADLKRELAELRELIKNHAKAHGYYGEERRSGYDRRQVDGTGPDEIERRSGAERRKQEHLNGSN